MASTDHIKRLLDFTLKLKLNVVRYHACFRGFMLQFTEIGFFERLACKWHRKNPVSTVLVLLYCINAFIFNTI